MANKYELGAIKKTTNLKLKKVTTKPKGSRYDPILEKMQKLKIGQSFTVKVPKSKTAKKFQICVDQAWRKPHVKIPKGAWFQIRLTQDENFIVVCCIKKKKK